MLIPDHETAVDFLNYEAISQTVVELLKDNRKRPVGPEYSCSLWKIDMVKAMDDREFNNVAGFRCSYGSTVRCVSIQGLVPDHCVSIDHTPIYSLG